MLIINLTLKYVIQNAWIDLDLVSQHISAYRLRLWRESVHYKREYQEYYIRNLETTKDICEVLFIEFSSETLYHYITLLLKFF